MDTELELNRDNLLSWLGFFLYPGNYKELPTPKFSQYSILNCYRRYILVDNCWAHILGIGKGMCYLCNQILWQVLEIIWLKLKRSGINPDKIGLNALLRLNLWPLWQSAAEIWQPSNFRDKDFFKLLKCRFENFHSTYAKFVYLSYYFARTDRRLLDYEIFMIPERFILSGLCTVSSGY